MHTHRCTKSISATEGALGGGGGAIGGKNGKLITFPPPPHNSNPPTPPKLQSHLSIIMIHKWMRGNTCLLSIPLCKKGESPSGKEIIFSK